MVKIATLKEKIYCRAFLVIERMNIVEGKRFLRNNLVDCKKTCIFAHYLCAFVCVHMFFANGYNYDKAS